MQAEVLCQLASSLFFLGAKIVQTGGRIKRTCLFFYAGMQFTFAFGAKIKKIVGWEKEKEIKNFSGMGEVRPAG